MISFIVIGRNEGWKLTKCLKSIFDTIDSHNLQNAEVIYIDSQSTDDSIYRAKQFKETKVFLITDFCNAAIARNIGANEATQEILFFIDGDMEINSDFLNFALDKGKLKFPCITGHLINYIYKDGREFVGKKSTLDPLKSHPAEENIKTGGGVFLITKTAWRAVDGMTTKYNRNEDIDLTIRLNKANIKVIRIPFIIVNHHTIEYFSEKRLWSTMRDKYWYYPGMLFRDHIAIPYSWWRAFRQNYTAFIFLISFIYLTLDYKNSILIPPIYLTALLIRSHKSAYNTTISSNRFTYILEKSLFQLLQDVMFWIGFFIFHPKNKKASYTSA